MKFVKQRRHNGDEAVCFQCPGCKNVHAIPVKGNKSMGPVWDWDGNMEEPTLSPSIRVRGGGITCHSYVRKGKIEFLGDCTHDLKGQTIEPDDAPDWLIKEGADETG